MGHFPRRTFNHSKQDRTGCILLILPSFHPASLTTQITHFALKKMLNINMLWLFISYGAFMICFQIMLVECCTNVII